MSGSPGNWNQGHESCRKIYLCVAVAFICLCFVSYVSALFAIPSAYAISPHGYQLFL